MIFHMNFLLFLSQAMYVYSFYILFLTPKKYINGGCTIFFIVFTGETFYLLLYWHTILNLSIKPSLLF